MTFSALALSTVQVAGLRLLCTVGSCAGFAVILLGLRLHRDERDPERESRPESRGANPTPTEPFPPQKVVRLSSDSAPTRSSDMTQQQKIAAALSRAGVVSPGWSQSETATSTEIAPPSDLPAKCDESSEAVQPEHAESRRKLVLFIGGILVVLSLILLFTLR